MTETITWEKHPGVIAQGHELAALMKKRKDEKLRNKEQSTEQPTVQSKNNLWCSLQYSLMELISMALV